MHKLVSRIGLSVLVLALAGNAQAATSAGQITTSMTLSSSCEINGAPGGATGVDFGVLDFGTTGSLFTAANGAVLAGGGGALSILCSSGTLPTVTVGAGTNDGGSVGGTRALADGSGNFVPYDLYTDTGRTQVLAIDGVITLAASTGVAQTVNIYGKAVGKAGLPAGTYSDAVAVVLTF
ncbi:Csu type fimbrial protein [Pseudomonas cucumis]|uniref:Spore coat protein U domain-containing protein n=1 Tax=Pseudomonas cucumis TaxID=2954082 RepID=A0ABY9EQJ2_9PSED|nr:spore coat protein U domain-containing protein [Pseudomonas cucumis]WLG82599.1 spore coat protein U domain-containing protein [Pseudomonas cucumis]WLG88204.1 spore coat protein U domain-containing protein [Pseudomonas cucumis]